MIRVIASIGVRVHEGAREGGVMSGKFFSSNICFPGSSFTDGNSSNLFLISLKQDSHMNLW